MADKEPDLDKAIASLETEQTKINADFLKMKLKCHPGLSSIAAIKHTKKASFDLSKLVPPTAM